MAAGDGRAPPAYMEYAGTMLASRPFRLMSASERGLLYSMRLSCWLDGTVPTEPRALAVILGLDADDVANALPAVMPFFTVENGELRCSELDAYHAYMEASFRDLAMGGSALIEKRQLLRGEPTAVIDFTTHKKVAELMPLFLAEARRRGLVIDGESRPVTHDDGKL